MITIVRSMLFLPGNSPKMLINGDTLDADGLIFDLEDAVAPEEKDAARNLVRLAMDKLAYRGKCRIVRINSISTPYWQEDIRAVLPLRPEILLPTKVESADELARIGDFITREEDRLGMQAQATKLMPLIETAKGVENAFEIACVPRVWALYLGAEDLSKSLHCGRTKQSAEILYSRYRLVSAARAAGVEAYDTPYTDVDDLEGLRKDALFARSIGFTGKASINPRHIAVINQVFSPSPEEIAYAEAVLSAYEEGIAQGKGVVSLEGKMIDAPVVARAKQTVEMAREIRRAGI